MPACGKGQVTGLVAVGQIGTLRLCFRKRGRWRGNPQRRVCTIRGKVERKQIRPWLITGTGFRPRKAYAGRDWQAKKRQADLDVLHMRESLLSPVVFASIGLPDVYRHRARVEKFNIKGLDLMAEIQIQPAHIPAMKRAPDPHLLMEKAQEMEAVFLTEMLAQCGLGATSESFGGGIGEEQFGSFLCAEQAKLMVERGGIGLAETLFRAMGGDVNEL
ncbi:rod-binding protein [Rhodobacter sp. 24-YEA-8]|uniref:rod-binding protein n=1 Tax=Rhodobacter sp. 24-YEA-8 TaxID=1884310 RepID=UPI00344EFC87